MLKQFHLVRQETNAEGSEGSSTESKNTEASKAAGSSGYAEGTDSKESPPQQTDQTNKQETKETVEKSTTGYDEADSKPPESDTKKEEKVELNFEGLSEEEVKTLKEYIAEKKLDNSVAQELVDKQVSKSKIIKDYESEILKKAEDQKKEQKSSWIKQLKEDKDFGGENFKVNVQKNETIIEKFFPNVKNLLTSKGGMLPPEFMKDLHGLHKVLLGSESFEHGEGSNKSVESDSDFLKNLYK